MGAANGSAAHAEKTWPSHTDAGHVQSGFHGGRPFSFLNKVGMSNSSGATRLQALHWLDTASRDVSFGLRLAPGVDAGHMGGASSISIS